MPRQYTTRRERKRLWCAFFLLLALAAFLLWQELSLIHISEPRDMRRSRMPSSA